jgi:S-DNA-T family DNA segregation ATPase FtsK/SpoIIIE
MALVSALMGLYMVSNIMSSANSTSGTGNNLMRIIPMAAMVVVMIAGAVLWPTLQSRYNKKKNAKKEAKRQEAYNAYLVQVQAKLNDAIMLQGQILTENRIPLAVCFKRVKDRDRRLWERTALHSDFLEMRIGMGDTPLDADVKWPPDRLTIEHDELKDRVLAMAKQPLVVRGVPEAISLVKDYVSGVIGTRNASFSFMRGLVAQIASLHAPDEVKVVLIADESDERQWRFMRTLPHCFNDEFTQRFIATSPQDAAELSLFLERELARREGQQKSDVITDYGCYYVVIVASQGLAQKAAVMEKLCALRENKGFSVITFCDNVKSLPKECSRIIELGVSAGGAAANTGAQAQMYDPREPSGVRTGFIQDISVGIKDANSFAHALARVPLVEKGGAGALPPSIGFLEMFEAAKTEHLNIASRWERSNPVTSLAVPLGVAPGGEPLMLDIHEDFHGPHGLIAGMTGSGKSEFIITYILSLAINFRPDEVSFVLIDYKGGGLAGAFDNEHARLPHLAGTITNLDGAAINRSLTSITAELRRRQQRFNEARDIAGTGTMDIYKYQELYRAGVVSTPITHLVLVADEFAELKDQQPEFMEGLISAARIGRSLGVHLILATQKPSGVVNDQIWSNARFKVCLKVAEAADSREMLKRTEAAELKEAGRFYLQVGYNEYFALGQSAYAGGIYRPAERFVKSHDDSVSLISTTGRSVLSAHPELEASAQATSTPESVAVLDQLVQTAREVGLSAPRLWLDPIPSVILLDSLYSKYAEELGYGSAPAQDGAANAEAAAPTHGDAADAATATGSMPADASMPAADRPLSLLVGEFDDPNNQRQLPLMLPLGEEGNAVIYGSPGSGKDMFVEAMLYSLIKTNTPQMAGAYVLDFESETLGMFKDAPQVADVLFSSESEKINRLFKMLNSEMARRRTVLAQVGLGFDAYTARVAGGADGFDPMPSIVLVIHGFEVFSDLYDSLVEALGVLSRDGLRCGIHTVLTASRSNAVSYRLLPNFKCKMALRMNSDDEYLNVIGSVRGVPIPKGQGRGLINTDRIYEFQTASIADEGLDDENGDSKDVAANAAQDAALLAETGATSVKAAMVAKLCGDSANEAAKMGWTVLPAVPILPQVVDAQTLVSGGVKQGAVPIGISREDIRTVCHDFGRSPIFMALGEDEQREAVFMQGLAKVLANIKDADIRICDPDALMDGYIGEDEHITYMGDKASMIAFIEQLVDTDVNTLSNTYLMGVSLRACVEAVPPDVKPRFDEWLSGGSYRSLGGLVVSGEPSRFTAFNYESWYREVSSYGNGIWLADNVGNQTALKISRIVPAFREPLKAGFGWYVDHGSATLVKSVVAS